MANITINDFCKNPADFRTRVTEKDFEYKVCLCDALKGSGAQLTDDPSSQRIAAIIEGIFSLQALEMVGGFLAAQKIIGPLLKTGASAAAKQGTLLAATGARVAASGVSELAAFSAEMSSFILRGLGRALFGAAFVGLRSLSILLDEVVLGVPLMVLQLVTFILDIIDPCKDVEMTQENLSNICDQINQAFANALTHPVPIPAADNSNQGTSCGEKYTIAVDTWPYYYDLASCGALQGDKYTEFFTDYLAKYYYALRVNSEGAFLNHTETFLQDAPVANNTFNALASNKNVVAGQWMTRYLWIIVMVLVISLTLLFIFL